MAIHRDLRRAWFVWRETGWTGLKHKIARRLSSQGDWAAYTNEAMMFATWLDFSPQAVAASRQVQADHPGALEIRKIAWFLPEIIHPFYGGIYTLLRFADYLKRKKGVEHRFYFLGNVEEKGIAEKIAQAFPSLAEFPVQRFNLYSHIKSFEPSDAAIATLWPTAYFMLQYNQTRRKFYFLQDYEPLFYPAGSTFAQVEATYRFGFRCIANTPTIHEIYTQQYGGQGSFFYPCVDTEIFHPAESADPDPGPVKIFFYGRPGHPRNGFELSAQALRLLKKSLGERVRIIAAGEGWKPMDFGLDGVVENLGRLSYRQTAELYRECQVGLVMMFTRHPSYLPLELMASGSLVVTNYNPSTTWLLKDRQNCLLAESSATCLAGLLEEAVLNRSERERITAHASATIRQSYSHWDQEIEKTYCAMCSPNDSNP
jgi:glycosyltransferase involved in cell wall biosynthesis